MAWDDVSVHGVFVWRKGMDKTISHHQDTVNAVQTAAKKLGRDAAFVLDNDSRTRTGEARIEVEHSPPRLLDSTVWLVSPSNAKSGALAAALSIENGHYRRRRAHGEGPRTGEDHETNWVEGVGPLRQALAKSLRERKMNK